MEIVAPRGITWTRRDRIFARLTRDYLARPHHLPTPDFPRGRKGVRNARRQLAFWQIANRAPQRWPRLLFREGLIPEPPDLDRRPGSMARAQLAIQSAWRAWIASDRWELRSTPEEDWRFAAALSMGLKSLGVKPTREKIGEAAQIVAHAAEKRRTLYAVHPKRDGTHDFGARELREILGEHAKALRDMPEISLDAHIKSGDGTLGDLLPAANDAPTEAYARLRAALDEALAVEKDREGLAALLEWQGRESETLEEMAARRGMEASRIRRCRKRIERRARRAASG